MKRPGIFSSVYAMSACCLAPPFTPPAGAGPSKAEGVKTEDDIAKADFGTKAQLASAAAWSPNPKNPPLYIDLPTKDGQPQPAVLARWAANAPLAMADQYIGNLKTYKAFALDVGDKDRLGAGVKDLDGILTLNSIQHVYEVYDGDHVNHVSDRVETKVLPFFTRYLAFQ